MLPLQRRIELMVQLGQYLLANQASLQAAKERAYLQNNWFTPENLDLAIQNIRTAYLDATQLQQWLKPYASAITAVERPKTVGIVMAGNIPLVGFHDLLCTFLSGHVLRIKPSSKDKVLLQHIIDQLIVWEPSLAESLSTAEMLKNCNAYIATGSNNSARYFEQYFSKYPHIIRRNRTSVALLTGDETPTELERLSDDVFQYFGLGCRNVTKLYVPAGYDFIPLLQAFRKYNHLIEHHKYKNNYDYNLALHLLNHRFYMSSEALLLSEHPSVFSPISVLHYEYYQSISAILAQLQQNPDIQCIVGRSFVPFGQAQHPSLNDYADGVNTMEFLLSL